MRSLLTAALLVLLAAAGARADDGLDLRVLSLNCWGIPYITPEWAARVPILAERVKALAPDIAALQEVWQAKDGAKIAEVVGLPYWRYFDAPGRAGLLVMSRFPIEAAHLDLFAVNGLPGYMAVGHMDWLSAKGVATTILRTPLGALPLLDTHVISAHPPDSPSQADRFTGERITQMADLADAVAAARRGTALPPLLCGDLNAEPDSPEIGAVRAMADLDDLGPAGGERRIDYVLGGRASGYALEVKHTTCAWLEDATLADGKRVRVTDHPYVLAEVRLRATPGKAAVERVAAEDAEAYRRAETVLVMELKFAAHDIIVATCVALATAVTAVFAAMKIPGRRTARFVAIVLGLAALAAASHAAISRPHEVSVLRATAARLEKLAPS
jgi:hypothetical protein